MSALRGPARHSLQRSLYRRGAYEPDGFQPHYVHNARCAEAGNETTTSVARCLPRETTWRQAMMDDRNDINRPLGSDPNANQRPLVPSASYSWGIPAGIAALFLLAGVLFYNSGGHG